MEVVTVGRLADNTVQLDGDSQVSRHHIQLTKDNGKYFITDLNSTNGTFVNGKQIQGTKQLQMRDVVRLGNTTIPWLMYFDTNYVRRLYSQRPKTFGNGQSPHSNRGGGGAIYVNPIQGGNNEERGKNGMGIAGFVLALLGVILCWVPILGWILWLLGLIFSIIGMCRKPKGLAIAGLVLSCIDLIILIVMVAFVGAAMVG